MVTPTYNIGTNTISWNYDDSLNWVDIYKFNTQNTTITHSSTELVPNFQSPNTYSLQISSLQLMGEQGITNANPYLLNTDPGYYQLGLSGSGPFVITNKFAITDNDQPIPNINGIPTYNSSTDVVNFSYSGNGNVDYVELYKVGYPANNRRFIDASAHIVDIVGSSPNYSVDLTNVTLFDKQGGTSLGPILDNGGTYYMGLKPSANPFTISGFFDIMPNTFKWVNTFPVGGVAIAGGEADNDIVNGGNATYITSGYNNIETELPSFYPKINLIRLPIVWAKNSPQNIKNNVLFTSTDYYNGIMPSDETNWNYNATYLTAIENAVTKFVNDDKVVIIDYHTYLAWKGNTSTNQYYSTPNYITDLSELAFIWGKTLDIFINPIFKHPNVWFELVNEPKNLYNLINYQGTINTIRGKGFKNKIIMGIDPAGPNGIGHAVNVYNSGGTFDWGFSSNNYTNQGYSFPTDSETNLCVTLHQYFNKNGSGSDYGNQYSSGNDMCSPTWLVSSGGTYTLSNGTPINDVIQNISTMCKTHNCDIILGEFGYDQSWSPTVGKQAIQTLLDAMEHANNNNTSANKQSTNILTKTQGGVWLGFASWQYHNYDAQNINTGDLILESPDPGGYFRENYIYNSMFSSVYSKYFI